MRIFIFLNFFCLQKNTFLTEINGVFIFSCFAFFFKNYTHAVFQFFVVFFYFKKNRFSMLKMKFPKIPKVPKMPKMPKIPTEILTAMGSYRNTSAPSFCWLTTRRLGMPISYGFQTTYD